MSYQDQRAWRDIQTFLPVEFQIPEGSEPTEEWWEHRGHRLHLDTYRNPSAPAKVILFHGVGTNGRQMSMILGRPLALRGYETIAIDMPGYGVTEIADGALVKYDDWVQIGSDLIERERDGRPIVLYGLSAGGMETFHVAGLNGDVAGIVGMTFLDQRIAKVRRDTAHDPVTALFTPLVVAASNTSLRRARLPMKLVSKMQTLVNNRALKRVFYRDKTSAGNSASIEFLASYLNYQPALEPEDFAVCPVLLTQPADDRWTPLELSTPTLEKIAKVSVTTVMLENAGHYPVEQPGLDQMVNAISSFVEKVASD